MTQNNFAQLKEPQDVLDSVAKMKIPFKKVQIMVSFAGQNRYSNSTKVLLDEALLISQGAEDIKSLAHSHYALGNYQFFHSKLDSALIHLNHAKEYVDQISDPLLESSIISSQGGIYKRKGSTILAISTFLESKRILDDIDTLKLSEKEKVKRRGKSFVLLNGLANLYLQTTDYEKSLACYDQAIVEANKLGDERNLILIQGNKGELLLDIEKGKEALDIFLLNRKLKKELHFPERFMYSNSLRLGRAYKFLRKDSLAQVFLQEAYLGYTKINFTSGLIYTNNALGDLFLKTKQYQKSLLYSEAGKALAKEAKDTEHIQQASYQIYQAAKQIKDSDRALANFEIYTVLKDSMYNEKKVRQMTEMSMQAEFDRKEAERFLIQERKNRQKNQLIYGLIAISIIGILLFLFYRNKLQFQKTISKQQKELHHQKIVELQQKNKLTALNSMIEGQEAERMRIAKDLHDSLGGLLSTIKSHYESLCAQNKAQQDKELSKKTATLVDEACIEVRRISHNMMPHALHLSGLKGVLMDMEEQLQANGYETQFELEGIPHLEETKKVMLYRLIQEIISNIKKHAAAKQILLQFFTHNNKLHLTIEDDGKGFNTKDAKAKGGLGLSNIESRVAFMDGNLQWDSEHNKGTTINIEIPV
ncbi:MAG: histidine kinase [Flavobacteriaceae bacterium]|nr:histidine kinase [Flavobacteriaceae bacterium]